jgi:hypothetical protein
MGSFKHPRVFRALDLEILDRVYEVALAHLEAREPFRDRADDAKRERELRKLLMDQARTDKVEFVALCERVLANMPEPWVSFISPSSAELQ